MAGSSSGLGSTTNGKVLGDTRETADSSKVAAQHFKGDFR